MIIQSTPVSFGAVGTPILVGVKNGLNGSPQVEAFMEKEGFATQSALLGEVGFRVALLHAICGLLIPLLVASVMTRFFGEKRSWRDGLAVWPFALFASLAMTIPYVAVARLLGPEFPSLIGGLVGLAIVVPSAKAGFLIRGLSPWSFPTQTTWPSEWLPKPTKGNASDGGERHSNDVPGLSDARYDSAAKMPLWRAWSPYLVVAVLLVLTRQTELPGMDFSPDTWIKSIKLEINGLLGSKLSHSIAPVHLPGTVFVIASLFALLAQPLSPRAYGRACLKSFRTVLSASVALIFTVPMVQVFINSAGGASDYASMPTALANGASGLTHGAWPLISPLVGGIGASIAGSNTVSNMMFALFQFDVGLRIGADPLWIVALQAVGGAAGNTICVHNVVTASAVVGIVGREGIIIRKTLIVFAYYVILAGLIGMLIVSAGL
jgi:lactate permease